MDRIVKVIVNTVFLIVLLAIVVNGIGIFSTYSNVKKIARTMIFYAQKNGGFVNSYDMDGNKLYDISNFYDELQDIHGLEDEIKKTTFTPGLGQKVIRRNLENESDSTAIVSFSIEIEPRYQIFYPFGEDKYIDLPIIKEVGFSQKYFKD